MTFAVPLEEIRAYWEALRGGRVVPARSDVSARGIEQALPYTFILERVAPQMARFRIAGGFLTDLMGMDVRGMPISAFFLPRDRHTLGAGLEQVFERPSLAEFEINADAGPGRSACRARMLILPLKSDLGDITRAIGGIVSDGPVRSAARRFSITDETIVPIQAGVAVTTDRRGRAFTGGSAPRGFLRAVPGGQHAGIPGMAEDAAVFRFAGAARPKLRVVRPDTAEISDDKKD